MSKPSGPMSSSASHQMVPVRLSIRRQSAGLARLSGKCAHFCGARSLARALKDRSEDEVWTRRRQGVPQAPLVRSQLTRVCVPSPQWEAGRPHSPGRRHRACVHRALQQREGGEQEPSGLGVPLWTRGCKPLSLPRTDQKQDQQMGLVLTICPRVCVWVHVYVVFYNFLIGCVTLNTSACSCLISSFVHL